jgi:hypothetical protein
VIIVIGQEVIDTAHTPLTINFRDQEELDRLKAILEKADKIEGATNCVSVVFNESLDPDSGNAHQMFNENHDVISTFYGSKGRCLGYDVEDDK